MWTKYCTKYWLDLFQKYHIQIDLRFKKNYLWKFIFFFAKFKLAYTLYKLFCLKNQFIIDKAPRSFFAEGLDRPKNYNESKKLSLSTLLLFYILCTESRNSLYLDGWSKNLLLFIRKEAIWWSFSLSVFEYHLRKYLLGFWSLEIQNYALS